MNLACALVEFGDKRGVEALHRDCDDPAIPTKIKLQVAIDLLALHEPSCPRAVVEDFAVPGLHSPDTQAIYSAAYAMLAFQDLSPEQYVKLRTLLLNNENPRVRREAVNGMGNLRDVGAIPEMEAALAKESDHSARTEMELALELLRSVQSESSSK